MNRHYIAVMLVACCATITGGTAAAQQTINNASLGGRVTDPQRPLCRAQRSPFARSTRMSISRRSLIQKIGFGSRA